MLNVAALNWHFGHYDAAAMAINETVRIAHQHQDHIGIALALAWLHRVIESQSTHAHHPQVGRASANILLCDKARMRIRIQREIKFLFSLFNFLV